LISLNKVAIVTGSSRGIGEAIAKEFAKAEYNIVINSRDAEELAVSKHEIKQVAASTTDILEFLGDISDESTCIGLVDIAVQKFGRIDVLINNAGISGPEKWSPEITSQEWDEVVDINLKGCFMCSREVIG
jgi:NAD(P)-dependent dehydrogenase (short-subunit alcohol dehydrogenase family)